MTSPETDLPKGKAGYAVDMDEENEDSDNFSETELVIREDFDDGHPVITNYIVTEPVKSSTPPHSDVKKDNSATQHRAQGPHVDKKENHQPTQKKQNPCGIGVCFSDLNNVAVIDPASSSVEKIPPVDADEKSDNAGSRPTSGVNFAPEVRPPLKGALKKATFKLDDEGRRESSESYADSGDSVMEDSNNNADVMEPEGDSSSSSPRRDSYVRMTSKDSDSVFSAEDDFHARHVGKRAACTIDAPLRNGLFVILSGIYGMILVVLGGVLPIAEVFEGPENIYYIEGYYLFLYVVSIAFMGYVYLYLLRSKQPSSSSWIPGWLLTSASQASAAALPSPARHRRRRISVDIRKNKQTGSFYLRLGAVGFGIGSMIHSGLQFGEYFQVLSGPSLCSGPLQALKPITHLMFTFVQLYFIFLNAKMCINKFQTVARFGLMHMIGTNMCVWFRNIIVETLHEIHRHESLHNMPDDATKHDVSAHDTKHLGHNDVNKSAHSIHHRSVTHEAARVSNNISYHVAMNGDSYHLPEISCHFNDVMGRVVEQAGPYLYPCTIEYSLICAGILYVMWRNVGRDHSRHLPPAVDGEIGLYKHRMSVDCSNSHRGLFMGIFLFVFAVISIIAFFVLIRKGGMTYTAVIFVNLCEILTYTLGTVATVVAFHRMRTLSYVMRGGNLEDNLILISLSGVYVFAIFSIIAATNDTEMEGGVFFIFADLLLMLQSTIQTIFMVSGMRMYATKSVQEREKPGREMVTFLLVTNIAMWGMTTFETQRAEHNPIQLHFYGYLSWSILTHISVPLAIFFRFHSTVCLSNIWKQAWKKRAALL